MKGLFEVSAALAAVVLVLFALEQVNPLRQGRMRLLTRLAVNVVLSAFALAVAGLLVRPLVGSLLGWSGRESFGLAYAVSMPPLMRGLVCFLFMDLTFYYWHLANHRVPVLWRFHVVHHVDPDLDVSTALRFHFGEIGLSSGLRILQVTLIGIDPLTYAIYETAFQGNTFFHHSNVRLPLGLERSLNVLLVTPRMHGIHHSQVQRETNSNYSVVLPWWDRLHRTLRLNVPQSKLTIGVPAYDQQQDQRLDRLLAMPFVRQRDYWRGRDGNLVERDPRTTHLHLTRMVE